jgi:hypothetical protein
VTAWLGVVSAEHVARGVSLGIAQLRQFTAVGRVSGDDIWQGDEGSFHPFRRAVDYLASRPMMAS